MESRSMRVPSAILLCGLLLTAACSSGGAGAQKRGGWRPGHAPEGKCETAEATLPEGVRLVPRHNPNPKPTREGPRRGYACVLATIDPSGMVTEAKLLDSNDPAFAEEFLKVVRTWRFDPVLVEGVPTEVRTVLPVTIQRQSFR